MKIVYAKERRVIALGGMRIVLNPGDPWDGDDPLVTEHPDAFVDGPATVRSTRSPAGVLPVDEPAADAPRDDRPAEPPVERATRAPGEKRNARAPRQSGEAGR